MEITALTALELGKKIKAGEVTVEEAVKAQLEKIKERDSVYNCYVTVMEEEALKRAAEVQKQIDAGELKDSPLAGVPVAKGDEALRWISENIRGVVGYNDISGHINADRFVIFFAA